MNLPRTKRFVVLFLGVLAMGVFGYALYRWLIPAGMVPLESGQTISGGSLPSPALPQPTPGAGVPETFPLPDLPSIAEERLVRLTDFPVASPALTKDETGVLFYKKSGGDLWRSDFTGKKQEKQTNLTIIGLIEALWQAGSDRGVVRYADADTIKSFLQIGTSTIAVLPQGITGAAWSPDGASLAYTLPRDDRLELTITDSAGKNPRNVFQTPLTDAHISWPISDLMAFATAPVSSAEGYLFAFSRRDGSFTKIAGPQRGLMARWSPDGATAAISGIPAGKQQTELTLFGRQKKESFPIPLSTLAEKCAWADAGTLFCAVPKNVPGGTILPDAWLMGTFNSADRIVRIDAATHAVSPVFDEGDFDMANLLITKDKKRLLFVSRRDGILWTLKLP